MSPRLRTLLLTSSALWAFGSGHALAGPDGPVVVGGSASVTGAGTSSVQVNQSSQRAIVNWNTFNIRSGETTTFVQPGSSSVVLNRVTGGLGPSEIYGTLNANGHVFVVNRDGVLIGPTGVINTGGFLATTHDIKNADFMAGRYNFNIPGRPDASVVNQGRITATTGGFAALVAPGVRNSGTITATLGTVALASGNSFTLDLYGDKLIQLSPSDQIAAKVIDVATGKPLKSLVSNEGKLSANGGRVELTAAAARAVVDSVINTKGVIEANSVGTRNGKIVLGAATGGSKSAGLPKQTVKISGTISAAGKEKGTKGGTVVVTGEDIQVTGARIDASGDAGGGKVMIGGDWGGGNPQLGLVTNPSATLESYQIATATTLKVDAATTIDASAKSTGNGGKVVLWSDSQTTFAGTIFARGGESTASATQNGTATGGGDGGFVEVSSRGQLVYSGAVDLRAPNGKAGTLLLDPADYYIDVVNGPPRPPGASVIDNETLRNQLQLGNVIIATNNSINPEGQAGDIFVNAQVNWTSAFSLTLSAYRNIQVGALPSEATIVNTGAGSLILRADSTGTGNGTVNLAAGTNANRIDWSGSTGTVSIFYNPSGGVEKYQSPHDYLAGNGRVVANSSVTNQVTSHMLVNTFGDLQLIASNLNGTYALGRDITADNMLPIGSPSSPFSGVLDGQGRTINQLVIAPNDITTQSIGLFGAIGATGVVRNLNITNASVSANPSFFNQWLGILAGQSAGTIDNVSATGTVNGTAGLGVTAGGLVGQQGILGQTSIPGSITNSRANVNVTVGTGDCSEGCLFNYAGGLVGTNVAGSTITNSFAEGSVTAGGISYAGGLVGSNGFSGFAPTPGSISNSYATGRVEVTGDNASAGGLVGYNSDGSTITNSKAFGTVVASFNSQSEDGFNNAGGLVGHNQGTITSTTQPTQGSSCTTSAAYSCAAGSVTVGANGAGGGLVGSNQGTINQAFASGTVTGAAGFEQAETAIGGLVGSNMGTITFSHATGNVSTTGTYVAAGELVGDNSGLIDNSFATGNVSTVNFGLAGGLVGGNSLNDCCFQGGGTGANNTATISNSFASGSVTVGNTSAAGGLIGVSDGTITNTSASGAVTGGADSILGGLVGAFGFNGGSISASTASGNVTGQGANSMVGGFVGVNAGTIDKTSSATGAVSGQSDSYIGGLVGFNLGRIEGVQSTATATVQGFGTFNAVGGLVGGNAGTIEASSAMRNVSGDTGAAVGGLVGINLTFNNIPDGLIHGSSLPVGTITNSSASGNVSGGMASFVGGLVGTNGGTIINSTASGNVSGGLTSMVGGLVGTNAGQFGAPGLPGILNQCDVGLCHTLLEASVSFGPGSIAGSSSTGAATGFGALYVGGLVGDNPGTITQSSASSAVSSNGSFGFVGGLVGNNTGGITNSFATGSVAVDTGFAGGFAGFNMGSIALSFATGNVTGGSPSFLGGFAGINAGNINQAYAKGSVTGGDGSFLGGFVGVNFNLGTDGLTGSITQSYALGPVTGGNAVVAAGFAALNFGTLDQTYAVGRVTAGAGSPTGGLVASSGLPFAPPGFDLGSGLPAGTVTNSYWDRQTTGQTTSAGGTPMDTSVLAVGLPPGFDPNIWSNGSYPQLVNLGQQDTNPGQPVLPPDAGPPPPTVPVLPPQTPTLDQQPPSQLQLVQDTTGTAGPPTTPAELVNTQTLAQQIQQQQQQQAQQQSADPLTTGSIGINNPIRLNVGDNRYFYLPPAEETRLVTDEVVVQLPCDAPQQDLDAALSALQLTVLSSQCLGLTNLAIYRLHTGTSQQIADVIRGLADHQVVAAAQANYVYALTQGPTAVPPGDGAQQYVLESAQYVLEKLRLIDIHRRLKATNIQIAVIDSEIDAAHPDLAGAIIDRYDATGVDEKPHPHGTGMAGAIASHRRLIGTAPGAHLFAIRAFSTKATNTESTTFNILKALDYAVKSNVRIVNMSFAGPRDPTFERAIKEAHDKGVIMIAAAGNAGPKSPPLYPAADKNVIAVTATDIDDKLFSRANRGTHIAVAAPGVDILVPAPDSAYQMTTGTSVATAHVSGIVALMLERNPRLTPPEVRRILIQSAKRLGPNDQFGAGLIDPVKALQLAAPRSAEAAPAPRR